MTEPIPIGSVSTYLRKYHQGIRDRGAADVPCGTCTACCRSPHLHAGLLPDEETQFPEAITCPDAPKSKCLPKKPDGTCIHLTEGRCAIYEKRPYGCRTFDCRAYRVIGFTSATDPIMDEALKKWDVPKIMRVGDEVLQRALQCAIAELRNKQGAVSAGDALAYALTNYRRFIPAAKR